MGGQGVVGHLWVRGKERGVKRKQARGKRVEGGMIKRRLLKRGG